MKRPIELAADSFGLDINSVTNIQQLLNSAPTFSQVVAVSIKGNRCQWAVYRWLMQAALTRPELDPHFTLLNFCKNPRLVPSLLCEIYLNRHHHYLAVHLKSNSRFSPDFIISRLANETDSLDIALDLFDLCDRNKIKISQKALDVAWRLAWSTCSDSLKTAVATQHEATPIQIAAWLEGTSIQEQELKLDGISQKEIDSISCLFWE